EGEGEAELAGNDVHRGEHRDDEAEDPSIAEIQRGQSSAAGYQLRSSRRNVRVAARRADSLRARGMPPPGQPRVAAGLHVERLRELREVLRADRDAIRAERVQKIDIGGQHGVEPRGKSHRLGIRPFVRREAVLSSRIEGTQATLGELLAAEAGAAVERSPDDLREVANYVVALEYGVRRLRTLPLSLRLVRELHEKLMRGVRGE